MNPHPFGCRFFRDLRLSAYCGDQSESARLWQNRHSRPHMPGSFTTLFLLLDITLLLAWRRYTGSRRKLAAVTTFCLLLQLYCTPVVSDLPAGWLEDKFSRLEHRPDDAGAIVVLSGSIRRPDTT